MMSDKQLPDISAELPDPWMPVLTLSGDFTVKPGTLIGPRKLDAYEIVYFPHSTATEYRSSDKTYLLSEPCITITRPDEIHATRFDPNRSVRHLFIVFELREPEADLWFSDFLQKHTHIRLETSSPVPTLFKHLLHLSDERKPRWNSRCAVLLFSILEELRGMAASSKSTAPHEAVIKHQLQAAVNYMQSHLHLQVTIEALAHHVGWSHAYFTRAFSRCFNVSPNQYLNRLRIEQACRYLLHETLSVKEIAARLGFTNEHYFSRLFKKMKGISASAYRRQYNDPRFKYVAVSNDQEAAYPVNHYFHYQGADA